MDFPNDNNQSEERGFIVSTTRKITISKQYLHVVVEKVIFAPKVSLLLIRLQALFFPIGDLVAKSPIGDTDVHQADLLNQRV